MTTLHAPAAIEVGAIWFPVLGFRPAIWTPPHRADEVDPGRFVPAPDADEPMLAKYDGAIAGYAWGTWLPSVPLGPGAGIASLPVNPGAVVSSAPPIPDPWWTSQPTYPCRCIEPPIEPIPPMPVPLDGAGAYLGGALIAAALMHAAWRIMPWLEAQKGASGWA